MNFTFILLTTIFIYLGILQSKYFLLISYSDGISKISFENRKDFLIYIMIPFSFLIRLDTFGIKDKKSFKILNVLSEILGIMSFLSLSFYYIKNILEKSFLLENKVFLILFYFGLISALLYLAIYDLVNFSIPSIFIRNFLFVIILINLIVGIIRFFSKYSSSVVFFQNIHLGLLDNLLAGIIFGLIIWFVIKITKDKGLGTGDIDVIQIIGFSLGFPAIVVVFLLTLISGSIISIIYAFIIKKYKGVIVPFVPFILIGFLITINFGDKIWEFLKFGSIFNT